MRLVFKGGYLWGLTPWSGHFLRRGFWRSLKGPPFSFRCRTLAGIEKRGSTDFYSVDPLIFLNRQVSGSEERRTVLSSTPKTPARTTPRTGDLHVIQSVLCRAPVFSLPPCTAHSLFSQKRGPRKIEDFVGRGGAKECSAAVAVRRLRSETDFAPTKWGVH